jgi:phosphate transport system permease protein
MTATLDRPPAPVEAPSAPMAPAGTASPRRLAGRTADEKWSLWGSLVGALAFVAVLYDQVLPWTGKLGFVLVTWLVFLLIYIVVSACGNPRPIVVERVAAAVITSGAGIVLIALVSTAFHVLNRGWPALHHLNFYTHDMSGIRPTDALNRGGILHAIAGSAIQLGIAVAIALPLGIGTAVYMTEVGGRLSRIVRTVTEAMTALPDILAGLFVYAVLIIGLHWHRTGLTAALALTVTAVPIIARSAEVVLRVVPSGLREAGTALGANQWQTVRRVVLPSARAGLATAIILAIARIVGETAPLLIVSGASTYLNVNPLSQPMNSLPLFIISAIRSGEPVYVARGYGAAAVLLLLVLALFIAARLFARDRRPKSRYRTTAQTAPAAEAGPSVPGGTL